jgi:Flp pilus assembly protein TadD/4-amino-4-deoxy-L-arabinose transferase-like glycosyltransferase
MTPSAGSPETVRADQPPSPAGRVGRWGAAPGHGDRLFLAGLLGVFLVAFGVRLVFLLQIRSNPFFAHPIVEAKTYDDWATAVAAGDLLGAGVFNQAPLYPYLLGLLYRVLGHDYFLARLAQIALGAANCCLICALGRAVFRPRVGLLAGLIMAGYGTLVFYDAELIRTTLVIFLSSASLLALLRAGRAPATHRWVAAGLLLGLAAITWETILLFVPAALLWGWLTLRGRLGPSAILGAGAALCLPIALVVLPVTARNYRVSGDFVLVSGWGGLNFYLGNNPAADVTTAVQPGEAWDEIVNLPLTRAGITRPSLRSRWFYREALSFVRADPLAWTRLLGRKLLLFWNAVEWEPNNDLSFYRSGSGLFRFLYRPDLPVVIPFGLVGPLALLGLLLLPRGSAGARLLALFLLASLVSLVLFHVRARYRITAVPALVLCAAWAVDRAVEGFRGGWTPRARVSALAALLALAVPVNTDFFSLRNVAPFPLHTSLGKVHLANGRPDLAAAEFREGVRANPADVDALVNLGVLSERQGRGEEALGWFLEARRVRPGSALVHNNLGVWYHARGRTGEALAALEKAVALDPGYADARYNLGVALLGLGRTAEAEQAFAKAIAADPRHAGAHHQLGTLSLARGDRSRAAEEFRLALRSDPGREDSRRALAQALGAAAPPESARP